MFRNYLNEINKISLLIFLIFFFSSNNLLSFNLENLNAVKIEIVPLNDQVNSCTKLISPSEIEREIKFVINNSKLNINESTSTKLSFEYVLHAMFKNGNEVQGCYFKSTLGVLEESWIDLNFDFGKFAKSYIYIEHDWGSGPNSYEFKNAVLNHVGNSVKEFINEWTSQNIDK